MTCSDDNRPVTTKTSNRIDFRLYSECSKMRPKLPNDSLRYSIHNTCRERNLFENLTKLFHFSFCKFAISDQHPDLYFTFVCSVYECHCVNALTCLTLFLNKVDVSHPTLPFNYCNPCFWTLKKLINFYSVSNMASFFPETLKQRITFTFLVTVKVTQISTNYLKIFVV